MTTRRDYVEALAAELHRAGIEKYEVRSGGKHPKLIYEREGRERFFVLSSTPSDARGVLNAVAWLRRELGIGSPEKVRSTRPARVKRVAPAPKPPALSTFAYADPLAALAAWKPAPRAYGFVWTRTGARGWRVERMEGARGA